MKMKKWLSAFLAVVLVVTAIPVSNLLVSAEETVSTESVTYAAVDDVYVLGNKTEYKKDNSGEYLGTDLGDLRWNHPSLYGEPYGIYTQDDNSKNNNLGIEESTYRWPYIAMKVSVEADGIYNLSVAVNSNPDKKANTFGMMVDGVMHVLSYDQTATKATVDTTVALNQGTHIILFTTTMPTDPVVASGIQTDAEKAESYPWFNFRSVTLGVGLNAEAAPTKQEVIDSACTRIEAEDIYVSEDDPGYVTYKNFLVSAETPATMGNASGGYVLGGVKKSLLTQETSTFSDYLDKKGSAYVQYTVNADKAGKYNIRVGVYAGVGDTSIAKPQIIIMANDTVQSKQFAGEWNTFGAVEFVVDLIEGQNIIRCIADQATYAAGGWVEQDYLDVQAGLSPVMNGTVDSFHGEDTKVLPNYYKDDTAGDESLGGIDTAFRASLPDIDSFQYASEKAADLPWTAFKVSNEKAGYYDITIGIEKGGVTSSNKMGIIVDGTAKVLQFTATANTLQLVNASVYLSAGEHIILFTTAIPESRLSTKEANSTYYPWFNFESFTFDDGINVVEDFGASENQEKSKKEVLASLGTRIEAEDTDKVTVNLAYTKDDGSNTGVSGTMLGGVSKSALKQSYEELQKYLDKQTMAYVQYTVEAPADGEYDIRVGIFAGEYGDDDLEAIHPYATLLVNDVAYRKQFTGDWNTSDTVDFTVTLKKGVNIIRSLALTTDDPTFSYKTYIDQDFLDVPAGITVVSNGTLTENQNADDPSLVYANNYADTTINGSLENSTTTGLSSSQVSVETLEEKTFLNIDSWSFTALKLKTTKAGYYDITLTANMKASQSSHYIGVLVNGKGYGKGFTTPTSNDEFKIDLSMYLKEGENIVVMTSPIPLNDGDTANYPWFNFHQFTLDDGIELMTSPTLAEIRATVANRIEAEDSLYVKYSLFDNFNDTHTNAPGETLVGGLTTDQLKVATHDQIAEYTDNKTPYAYVQYAVNAPTDGNYTIRINSFIGCTVLPYVSVLVNGNAYKASFSKNWACVSSDLTVALHEGINYIRVSSVTADQTDVLNGNNKWISHNYLEVPREVTPVLVADLPTSTTSIDAWDKTQVLIRNYNTVTSTEVGDAVVSGLREKRLSFENLMDYFDSLAYTAIKVNAEKDGYYNVSVQTMTNKSTTSKYVPVIVDGTRICALQISATGSKETYGGEISLKKGEHTLLFATPMPLTSEEANKLDKVEDEDGNWVLEYDDTGAEVWSDRAAAYPWFNFYNFTLGNSLEALAAPTEAEVLGDVPALGDVNHDGSIDEKDTEVLRKYLVGLDVVINLVAANTHEDEYIDIRDLVAEKKIIKSIETNPTAYLSDMNEEFAIQEAEYITTYAYDSETFDSSGNVIEIDSTSISSRKIDGFGASFTDTSAYVLSEVAKTNQEGVDKAIENLFNKENGIGLSMIRNCIGSSDFSAQYYTYEDIEGEFALAGGETKNILLYTTQALKENEDIKVILSPWSAPLWMKTEVTVPDGIDEKYANVWQWLSVSGSTLKEECYDKYATYLANTVTAYQNAGIPVYAITPQNEPWTSNNWIGMSWQKPSEDYANIWNMSNSPLIKFTNQLKQTLTDNKLDTKILNLDYNYSADANASLIMKHTSSTTDGLAFHWYNGEPENMLSFANTYSDKLIYVTEASSGTTARKHMNNEDMLKKTNDIVRALRSGAQAYMTWNIALSSEGGPTYGDINEHCFGLLSCDINAGKIEYTKDYYALAHFSKFIDKGAACVDSTDTGAGSDYQLVNVVTKNSDGSMVAVIVNSNMNDSQVCKLVDKKSSKVMEITLAPRSTVTITWTP